MLSNKKSLCRDVAKWWINLAGAEFVGNITFVAMQSLHVVQYKKNFHFEAALFYSYSRPMLHCSQRRHNT